MGGENLDKYTDAVKTTEQLFNLYKNDVYRYARFMLGNSTSAEDIVQEVFIRVLKYWHHFRGDANPKTWLWTIIRSCLVDYRRKHKKEKQHVVFNEIYSGHTDLEIDPFNEIEEQLQTLTPNQREVIILRIVQDCSVQETSHILGWSQGKVKTTLHRGTADKTRILYAKTLFGNKNPNFSTLSRRIRV